MTPDKKATDRQKMLAAHAAALSNPHLPLRYTPVGEITQLEGRVIGHAIDDDTGIPHMILESKDAIHLIPHNADIDGARAAGRLAPTSVVTLQPRAGRLRINQPRTNERGSRQVFRT